MSVTGKGNRARIHPSPAHEALELAVLALELGEKSGT
jgi:hypothetical protein